MYKWTEKKDIISQTGVKLLLNNPELIELCSDKWLFYNKLKENYSKYAINSNICGNFEAF